VTHGAILFALLPILDIIEVPPSLFDPCSFVAAVVVILNNLGSNVGPTRHDFRWHIVLQEMRDMPSTPRMRAFTRRTPIRIRFTLGGITAIRITVMRTLQPLLTRPSKTVTVLPDHRRSNPPILCRDQRIPIKLIALIHSCMLNVIVEDSRSRRFNRHQSLRRILILEGSSTLWPVAQLQQLLVNIHVIKIQRPNRAGTQASGPE